MKLPRCRSCGKWLPKKTVAHTFGHSRERRTSFSVEHVESASTREEAQRYVNGLIISTARGYNGQIRVNVWDGESYAPRFDYFCKVSCAAAFGRLAAQETDLQTQSYADAVAKR